MANLRYQRSRADVNFTGSDRGTERRQTPCPTQWKVSFGYFSLRSKKSNPAVGPGPDDFDLLTDHAGAFYPSSASLSFSNNTLFRSTPQA